MKGYRLQLMLAVVINDGWVQSSTIKANLEMEVLCGSPTGTARQTDYLTSLYLIALLHLVPTLMTVERLETISMPDTDTVAVTIVGS